MMPTIKLVEVHCPLGTKTQILTTTVTPAFLQKPVLNLQDTWPTIPTVMIVTPTPIQDKPPAIPPIEEMVVSTTIVILLTLSAPLAVLVVVTEPPPGPRVVVVIVNIAVTLRTKPKKPLQVAPVVELPVTKLGTQKNLAVLVVAVLVVLVIVQTLRATPAPPPADKTTTNSLYIFQT